MRAKYLDVALTLGILLAASSARGEVRSYEFVGDLPAYRFSCGECSGPPYTVRAKVQGTFDVDLDFVKRKGRLLSLDVKLVAPEGNFGPDVWNPIVWHEEFFQPYHYEPQPPPHDGRLTPAELRAVGPDSLTDEYFARFIGVPTSEMDPLVSHGFSTGVAYEAAPPNSWTLYFSGAIQDPGEMFTRITSSYIIHFQGNEAMLSYYVPIIDATPWIAAARATLVSTTVPEPGGLMMCLFAAVGVLMGQRWTSRRASGCRF